MKAVVYSPVALARFADILGYTIERFGAAQADVLCRTPGGTARGACLRTRPESPALRTLYAGRAGSLRVDLLSRRISLPDSAREAGGARSRRNLPRTDEYRGAPGTVVAGGHGAALIPNDTGVLAHGSRATPDPAPGAAGASAVLPWLHGRGVKVLDCIFLIGSTICKIEYDQA